MTRKKGSSNKTLLLFLLTDLRSFNDAYDDILRKTTYLVIIIDLGPHA